MPGLLNRLVARVPPWSLMAFAAALPLAHAAPASAQDLFGFLRLLSPPRPEAQPAPVAAEAPVEAPAAAPSPKAAAKARPRPAPVRLTAAPAKARPILKAAAEQPRPRMPSKEKPEGDIANPVPALLSDNTLRSGDLAMFPTDLRVFTGRPGTRHVLSDFAPLPRAGKTLAPVTQRLAAGLRPGWNAAWDAGAARPVGKLAAAFKEAEATQGSPRKAEQSGPLILRGCPGRAAQSAAPPHPQEKLLILCVPESNGADIIPPPSATRALLPDGPFQDTDRPVPAVIALERACPPLASCDVDELGSDQQTGWDT
jgi:hypothetical protein